MVTLGDFERYHQVGLVRCMRGTRLQHNSCRRRFSTSGIFLCGLLFVLTLTCCWGVIKPIGVGSSGVLRSKIVVIYCCSSI